MTNPVATSKQLSPGTTPNFAYDAAGDATYDTSHNYTFDAEGHIIQVDGTPGTCSSATECYVYDGDGRRVEKATSSVSEIYCYGSNGSALDETDGSGDLVNEYVFFNGARIARRDSSSNVYYYFGDHLGSTRVETNASGTVCFDSDYYPFGAEINEFTSTCSTNYRFTGKERDSETGLDNSGARYYASQFMRFTSPDPSLIALADLGDPQQLNLYSYVRNNPLALIDPTGLGDSCPGDWDEASGSYIPDPSCAGGADANDNQDNTPTNPSGDNPAKPPQETVTNSELDALAAAQNATPSRSPYAAGGGDHGSASQTSTPDPNQTAAKLLSGGDFSYDMPEPGPSQPQTPAPTPIVVIPQPRPGYKPSQNQCLSNARDSFALHLGVDAVGLLGTVLPGAGLASTAGGIGLVAMDLGTGYPGAGTGLATTGAGLAIEVTKADGVGTALAVGRALPIVGGAISALSILSDIHAYNEAKNGCAAGGN